MKAAKQIGKKDRKLRKLTEKNKKKYWTYDIGKSWHTSSGTGTEIEILQSPTDCKEIE